MNGNKAHLMSTTAGCIQKGVLQQCAFSNGLTCPLVQMLVVLFSQSEVLSVNLYLCNIFMVIFSLICIINLSLSVIFFSLKTYFVIFEPV